MKDTTKVTRSLTPEPFERARFVEYASYISRLFLLWLTSYNGRYSSQETVSMVRRYPPNPRGTENVFSDIRVLSIEIYVLSFSCLGMGINLVQDKGPRD